MTVSKAPTKALTLLFLVSTSLLAVSSITLLNSPWASFFPCCTSWCLKTTFPGLRLVLYSPPSTLFLEFFFTSLLLLPWFSLKSLTFTKPSLFGAVLSCWGFTTVPLLNFSFTGSRRSSLGSISTSLGSISMTCKVFSETFSSSVLVSASSILFLFFTNAELLSILFLVFNDLLTEDFEVGKAVRDTTTLCRDALGTTVAVGSGLLDHGIHGNDQKVLVWPESPSPPLPPWPPQNSASDDEVF
nr:unnamed protein product [Ipomoea batatas]